MNAFNRQLQLDAQAIHSNLDKTLGLSPQSGEIYRPQRLIEAMRHGVLSGGKRLRPFLVLQSGALFGAQRENLIQIATALECIHCYSLIHDDLPAMDDDRLRRGLPTVHVKYDEATAILTGDALLTHAFELLADEMSHDDPATRLKIISLLAKASGLGGMVGGQMLDLQPESQTPSPEEVARMQSMKTGALIKFACQAGAICGDANENELSALETYGTLVGQAFQLADDILDATASSDQLGKNAAKDLEQGKLTQVAMLGVPQARKIAQNLVSDAHRHLEVFGEKADLLRHAADFTIERMH